MDDQDGDGTAGEPTGEETVVRRDRFAGGPARSFLSSLAADRRIFGADLAVDRAHVVMLAEQGIVGDDEAGAILAALDSVEEAGHGALPDGEDVHEAIETAVVNEVGPVGGKLHTARSRNDEVATCIRYRLRSDLLDACEATLGVREALVGSATEHGTTLLPGYTHLQPAQPTTVGHWLLSYEGPVARDTSRLLDAFARVNESPLGGAAFAGTPFDVDRGRTAELLGFDGVVRNSMDAAASRDVLVEAVSALASLAVTLSGVAEDLTIYANRGFVTLGDDYASTSSIMPQKVNPDTMELVRASAGDAVGELTGLLTTLKGLPRAYNRDLQRATPHAWDAVDAVTEAAEVVAGAVATATWHEDACAAAAGEGFSTATGLADALAMAGVPFRTAHELVAAVAESVDGSDPAAVLEALESAAVAAEGLDDPLWDLVDEETLLAALDPEESVASRDSTGGPAPAAVASQAAAAESGIEADRDAVEATREDLAAAEETLRTEVASYV